jgi:hypothetical protein
MPGPAATRNGNTVDRDERDRLALLLRRLLTGRITTDDFDCDRPDGSSDEGVDAISWAAWTNLYSDFFPIRLVGRRRLHGEKRQHVLRWILFLKSDVLYEWPNPPSLFQRVASYLARPFSRRETAFLRWTNSGDFHVWPFLRQDDYERVLADPPYLRADDPGGRPSA